MEQTSGRHEYEEFLRSRVLVTSHGVPISTRSTIAAILEVNCGKNYVPFIERAEISLKSTDPAMDGFLRGTAKHDSIQSELMCYSMLLVMYEVMHRSAQKLFEYSKNSNDRSAITHYLALRELGLEEFLTSKKELIEKTEQSRDFNKDFYEIAELRLAENDNLSDFVNNLSAGQSPELVRPVKLSCLSLYSLVDLMYHDHWKRHENNGINLRMLRDMTKGLTAEEVSVSEPGYYRAADSMRVRSKLDVRF